MLKLILADDEKVIRETISSLINWDSLGIELAAVCENGPETLQEILDIKPDIVMTDIKRAGKKPALLTFRFLCHNHSAIVGTCAFSSRSSSLKSCNSLPEIRIYGSSSEAR